jgi:hypothetical protein
VGVSGSAVVVSVGALVGEALGGTVEAVGARIERVAVAGSGVREDVALRIGVSVDGAPGAAAHAPRQSAPNSQAARARLRLTNDAFRVLIGRG